MPSFIKCKETLLAGNLGCWAFSNRRPALFCVVCHLWNVSQISLHSVDAFIHLLKQQCSLVRILWVELLETWMFQIERLGCCRCQAKFLSELNYCLSVILLLGIKERRLAITFLMCVVQIKIFFIRCQIISTTHYSTGITITNEKYWT